MANILTERAFRKIADENLGIEYVNLSFESISKDLFLVALVGIILSAVFSIFMAKTISRPIINLKKAITEASKGNLMVKVDISSKDEIGILGQEFNQMMDVISELTYYDPLTNLASRKVFEEQLDLAITHSKRNKENLAVMIIGIDKFKKVNDAFGLSMGDKVLKEISRRINGSIREEYLLSRITGDEFAVFFPEVENEKHVIRYVERILEVIKKPLIIDNNEIHVSASAGLAFYPKDGICKDGLLKNATIALSRSKQKGAGTYQLYTPLMKEEILEQMELEKMMPKGIENGEFKLYYQPIIDVKTLSIIGMEALVCWNHPVLGMISPEKFIPIAEENGFIVTLGEWVLKTACRQNKAWQNAGFKKIFVSVNISLRQFQNKNFVKMIKDILNETSFDSKYLGLEITESIAMENEDYTIEVLRELKDMGLYLAIDDFGTGYSSLGYLNKFPIDTLKIDKSFIKTLMDEKENSAPIASSIIALGHNLNLKITAEGVETMDQFKYLKKQNCDAIQGYLFSKPLTSDEFEDLLGLPKLTVQPEYSKIYKREIL
jgi:diguanylate cyclase (GGDEF)-like protein